MTILRKNETPVTRTEGTRTLATQTREADRSPPGLAFSRHLVDLVRASLEDDKAQDIVVIDLAGKSSIADFMVIASGGSQRHVGAMSDRLHRKLKAATESGVTVEGANRCDWVLIDGGDVIVHIFRPDARAFYGLEKMWGAEFREAPRPAVNH